MKRTKQEKTARRWLESAPVNWEWMGNELNRRENKQEIVRTLEAIARRAAMLARYLDTRIGYGCGDQGHRQAMNAANKAGKAVWCGAFGYNEHPALKV